MWTLRSLSRMGLGLLGMNKMTMKGQDNSMKIVSSTLNLQNSNNPKTQMTASPTSSRRILTMILDHKVRI